MMTPAVSMAAPRRGAEQLIEPAQLGAADMPRMAGSVKSMLLAWAPPLGIGSIWSLVVTSAVMIGRPASTLSDVRIEKPARGESRDMTD
jgi:hypothetical protein